jgi:hypothetical protein
MSSNISEYSEITKEDFISKYLEFSGACSEDEIVNQCDCIDNKFGIDFYFKGESETSYGFVFNTGELICKKSKINFGNFQIYFDFSKIVGISKLLPARGGNEQNFVIVDNRYLYCHYNIYDIYSYKGERLVLCDGANLAKITQKFG